MTLMLMMACLDESTPNGPPVVDDRDHLDFTHLTVALGYEDEDPARQDIFWSQAEWDAQLEPHESQPEVDWDTQLLFLYGWVDGGCGTPPEFEVWMEDDGTVLASTEGHDRGACDAYFPTAELLDVDAPEATDALWE